MSVQNTETAVPLPDDKTGKDGVQRRTNVRWKMFLLLLVLVAVNYIDRGSISVALPIIQKEFNLAPGARGPPALRLLLDLRPHADPGRPPDRQVRSPQGDDRRPASAGAPQRQHPGLAGGFLSMFIARLGIGVTEAGVMPAGGKLNAIWMHKSERGRGATILDAGAPLGAGLGGILIAGLIASTGSWRIAFIIAGAATVLMGLAVWWYVRDNPRQHRGVNDAEAEYIEASHAAEDAEAELDGSKGKRALLPYLKFRSFWAMCFGWLGFNGVFYGLLTWGPLYLAQAKGFDLKTIGWSTFVIFGAGFVGEILGGTIADKWRASGASANRVMRTLLGTSSVVVIGGLIGVTVVADPTTAVVLLSVVMFFLRWVGLFWSIPSILGGRTNAGVLGGAMNFSGNISGFVTPIAVGLIVGATGSYTWALLYFVGSAIIMGVSVLTLNYNKRLPV